MDMFEREKHLFDEIYMMVEAYYYDNGSSIDEIRAKLQAYVRFADSDLADVGLDESTRQKLRSERADKLTMHPRHDLNQIRLWEKFKDVPTAMRLTEENFDRGVEIWNVVYSPQEFYAYVAQNFARPRGSEGPYTEAIIKGLLQQLLQEASKRANGTVTFNLRLR